jgi:hypothetical protein
MQANREALQVFIPIEDVDLVVKSSDVIPFMDHLMQPVGATNVNAVSTSTIAWPPPQFSRS